MTQPKGQLAPYSQEAEEAVLGAVLVDPQAFVDVALNLDADDFYLLRHNYIWTALKRLNNRDVTIDIVTVTEELSTMKRLEDVGGPGYLLHLINSTPTSMHAKTYGQLVHRAAIRRRGLIATDEIRALLMDEKTAIEDVGVAAWQRLEQVGFEGSRERSISGGDSIQLYNEVALERQAHFERGDLMGVPLPERWSRLKDALPSLFLGDFVVVSGGSGSGKSAWCESFAEHCAQIGLATDYIHTEMSTEEVLDRRMARHSGVSFQRLASGDILKTPQGYNPHERMLAADVEIIKWVKHLAYHWLPDVQFTRLQIHMKRAAMMGVKVFILDHFQDVVPPASKGGNDVRAIEAMAIWLNAFAEMRKVLVVCASQLNDQGKVKWARKLTEKADVWLNIKRERLKSDYAYLLGDVEYMAYKGEDSPRTKMQINKARFGKKGEVEMLYHGQCFAWHDMSDVRTRVIGADNVISLEEMQARHRAAAASEG